jgi:thiol-disulfide isomerase/thioredoxin
MKKSSLIGIFLLLLMVSSTLIYFISSIFLQPTLPESNIVDYELDVQQKNLVLRQGKVLMEFLYSKDCQDCQEKINFLEDFAKQYQDKVFLEKILLNESVPKLHFIGFNVTENRIYLQEKLLEGENIKEENVKEVFCEVALYPPVECAGV